MSQAQISDRACEADTQPEDEDRDGHVSAPMSLKQLGRTVLDGRKVTWYVLGVGDITGYLAGIDDDSWFVLEPTEKTEKKVRRRIIQKGLCPALEIHDHRTYDEEPLREEMERQISRFRTYLKNQVFHDRNRSPRRPSRGRT